MQMQASCISIKKKMKAYMVIVNEEGRQRRVRSAGQLHPFISCVLWAVFLIVLSPQRLERSLFSYSIAASMRAPLAIDLYLQPS